MNFTRLRRMAACQQRWRPEARRAKAVSPSSVSASLSQRFQGGAHLSETPRQHHVRFQMSALRIERRMAGRALTHEAAEGGWQFVQLASTVLPMPKEES